MNLYTSFVNLDSRPDRLAHITAQLERVGLYAVRTRGLLPHEVNIPMEKIGMMMRRTEGAVGCWFSQMQIMEEALAIGKDALVLEDDCIFCEDFNERLAYMEKWAETHPFDILWLGASFHVSPPYWHNIGGSTDRRNDVSANLGRDAETTDDPRMMRTYGAFSTMSYIVNHNSIEKVLALLHFHMHESVGIDHCMIRIQPQLLTYSFVPGCVRQLDNQSNIGNGITYWSGFLQLNGTKENSAYVFQNLMSEFDPLTFNWSECQR
jgi:GR25 family glycosyltransferase involved in LPS biosynthesis